MKSLLPYLLFAIYKLLQWTWRMEIIEHPLVTDFVSKKKVFTIAHWHGDELGIICLLGKYNCGAMVSTSKDGEIMNKAAILFGAETARGSSTRKSTQALKGLVRLAKKGRRPSIAVDGPVGPIHKVKPGVFQIARMTKTIVIPVSFACSRPFVFHNSWNQAVLPKPFSRVVMHWGEPMEIDRNLDVRSPELANQLAMALHATKNKAKQCI